MGLFVDSAGAARPLAPAPRLFGLLLGYGIYCLYGPGVLGPDGSPLAFLGVALWGLAARRPGRGAALCDFLAAGLFLGSQIWWIAYVWAPALAYVFAGYGVYGALGGALLRRMSRRWRPAVAVPAAWVGVETLRALLPPPFGLSWMALGHYAVATPWLAGSARLWGAIGLGFALGAAAGLAVELLEWRRGLRPAPGWAGLALGGGPALVAALLASTYPAPRVEPGPRLLLVQPAFEQARKQNPVSPLDQFVEQVQRTARALDEEQRAGRPAPDLVCWGETMLYAMLADGRLREAAKGGLEVDAWLERVGLDPEQLDRSLDLVDRHEYEWVARALFGREPENGGSGPRILPEGSSFLSGAEFLVAHAGRLRRMNAVALWGPDGTRQGVAAKVNLVPGGETMLGLERVPAVRDFIQEVSGYVPNLLAAERTGVLTLETRGGRRHPFGATVCFDNAYLDAYTGPLRRGELDFHVVVSNEAWYLDSFEMDQMIAFSRLAAIASGRSVVRATNAGITAAFGPDGREIARLVVDGADRLVPGTLLVQVPVPARSEVEAVAPRPLYVALEPGWRALALLLPLALAVFAGGLAVTGGSSTVTRGSRGGGAPSA